MRSLIVLGGLLLLVGLFTYLVPVLASSSSSDVTQLPNMIANTQTTSTLMVPLWASAAAMVAGLLMMIVGAASRTHTV